MTAPKTLSPEECEAIQARTDAATPGPWSRFPADFIIEKEQETNIGVQNKGGLITAACGIATNRYSLANATFIAASRTDVPSLLHTIAELRKEVARLEAERDGWKKWKGEGDPPPCWEAVNPHTGERTIIYRDYAAYCMD